MIDDKKEIVFPTHPDNLGQGSAAPDPADQATAKAPPDPGLDSLSATPGLIPETAPAASDGPTPTTTPTPTLTSAVPHSERAEARHRAAEEAEVWGFVDEEGGIHLKEGRNFPARIVGKVRGKDPKAALAVFALRFKDLLDKAARLETEVREAPDPVRKIETFKRFSARIEKVEALGDFDSLIERLRGIEEQIDRELVDRLKRLEEIGAEAEKVGESSEWKAGGEKLQELQARWKSVGFVPKERSDPFWNRLKAAADLFYQKRREHYHAMDRERQANLEKKEKLCAEAGALRASSDWGEAAEKLQKLQAEWKKIGPAPNEVADEIWDRFRAAQDDFFNRRREHFEQLDREHAENLKKKEVLCEEAEGLADSAEWKATSDNLKKLQADWKAIGPVPRSKSETIWARFRGAMDKFYARRDEHFSTVDGERQARIERKRAIVGEAEALQEWPDSNAAMDKLKELREQWKHVGAVPREEDDSLWRRLQAAGESAHKRRKTESDRRQRERADRMEEALQRKLDQRDRLRLSLDHDSELIGRWETMLGEVREGARAEEVRASLREKIESVTARIQSKTTRVQELETDINDIEGRLR